MMDSDVKSGGILVREVGCQSFMHVKIDSQSARIIATGARGASVFGRQG
jgi:hypothetical protein